MVGHGAKFSRKKEEAIAALLTQRSVEEAARVAGIGSQTLSRWMKDPEFAAAYRKARCAGRQQAIARLQQASGAAATALLKVVFDPGAPAAARLKAADRVLSHGRAASELEEIGARLSALKRVREASRPARRQKGDGAPPADDRGSSRIAGHGAKFPRKKEAAIVALLTQRNVEEAARVVRIATTTLYRWMKDSAFSDAYREARLAAFGQAGARLQQASGPAVTVILKIMADPCTPAGTRVRAADLVLKHAQDASGEDLEACLAGLDCATEATPAGLDGHRRSFDEEDLPPFIVTIPPRIAREPPKVAA
jgi:transposase-like protein